MTDFVPIRDVIEQLKRQMVEQRKARNKPQREDCKVAAVRKPTRAKPREEQRKGTR
ncbi:MAG: hypothetical protein WC869_10460 [Phycisphaerae bacterium]|jgi:hypothetical protein